MKKIIASMLVMLLILAGCQSSDTSLEKDFTFVTVTSQEPQSFHPDRVSDDGAWPINQNVFSRLIKLNAFNEYVPDLAKSWEFSEDGMTLTFHLNSGVKWHDGEDFSSSDVKYTYDTIKSENFAMASNLSTVDSIDTPDADTVVFNLSVPDSSIVAKLSWYGMFILPQHIYEGTDHATNPANQSPIGTGPFKFVKYESGVAATLERFDDYFGGASDVKTLIFRIIPDQNTSYQAFLNGELDYIGSLPTQNVDDLDDDSNYEIVQTLGINRTYVTFNLEDEDFSKLEVRQAVAYALDQQSVFDRVGGAGQKAEYLISPVFTDYINDSYTLPETNVDKAIELLESAGYTKNANGYYIEADFDFFTGGNFADVATIVAANLEKAGIKLNLNALEYSAWVQKVRNDGNFSFTMLAGYQGPDVSGVDGRVKSDGATNIAGYANAEIDDLLSKAVQYSDVADRKEYYDEVQRILSEDLPIVFILENGYKTPIKTEFKGTPYQDETVGASEFSKVQKVSE